MTFWKRYIPICFSTLLLLSCMKTPMIFTNCEINNTKGTPVSINATVCPAETLDEHKNATNEHGNVTDEHNNENKDVKRKLNESSDLNTDTTNKTIDHNEVTTEATNKSLYIGYMNKDKSDEGIEMEPTIVENVDIKAPIYEERCGLANVSMYLNCSDNTCKGRCGEKSNYTTPGMLCSCDSECHIYQDCCKDFMDICTNISSVAPKAAIGDSLSCKYISSERNIYVKQSCKHGYSDRSVIEKCYDAKGIEGLIPMTDSESKIVYANHFCALCNNATHIVPWKMNVMVKKLGPSRTNPTFNDEILLQLLNWDYHVTRKLSFYEFEPAHEIPTRQCPNIEKTRCHFKCQDSSVKKLCETGDFDPQYSRYQGEFVRNKHCLRCSNRNVCQTYFRKSLTEAYLSLFTYSILVDTVRSSGIDIQLKGGFGIADLNSKVKYSNSKLTILKCGKHFTFINGKCTIKEPPVFVDCIIPTKYNISQNEIIETSESIKEAFDIVEVIVVEDNNNTFIRVTFWIAMDSDTEEILANYFNAKTNLIVRNLSFAALDQDHSCSYKITPFDSKSQNKAAKTTKLSTDHPRHSNSDQLTALRGLVIYLLFFVMF